MTSVAVINESSHDCDTAALIDMLHHHMGETGIDPMSELDVLLVDEPHMSELHEQWMGEPGPTDVLSFPMDELRPAFDGSPACKGMLGDVVVCLPVAQRQADLAQRSLDAEVQFLVTHGYLHLLGYDHAEPAEYDAMFTLQDTLLAKWRERDQPHG